MSYRFVMISLMLLFCSLLSHAEINLVEHGKAISLLSSAERARLGLTSTEIEISSNNQARILCGRVAKKFKRYVIAELRSKNIEEKSYQAMIWQAHIEGLSFAETTFPLVAFPEKIPTSVYLENGFYATSGIILAAGGLMTLMLCMGMDGPPNFFAAKITAGITAELSIISALSGAGIHMRRSYLESEREAGEDEECAELSENTINYAMPVLVSELWCE